MPYEGSRDCLPQGAAAGVKLNSLLHSTRRCTAIYLANADFLAKLRHAPNRLRQARIGQRSRMISRAGQAQKSEELVMAGSDFPGPERRRSARTKLVIPLRVHSRTRAGENFTVEAETHTVSDSGCLIYLESNLSVDQTIVLLNEKTGHSIQGKVVSTWRHPGGRIFVGVEFSSPTQNFWRSELPSSQMNDPPQPKA